LYQQAAKARRLAKSVHDDKAATKLLEFAAEYEALAKDEPDEADPEDTVH
jgi:hypothetical protein